MITFKQVNFSYVDESTLTKLDLTIPKGQCVVLCGASGSGKSTVIRLLTGLIPELYTGTITGEATVANMTLPPVDFEEYVKQIGVVFQNPKTQFFTNNVYSELAFNMENYGTLPSIMQERIASISETFRLSNYLDKSMFHLSGGEKQRIAFASVCMMPHQVYLLDEPSSNLDLPTIAILKEYIQWLKTTGATIIVAEHRLAYLMDVADRFVYLDSGRIQADWSKKQLLELTHDDLKTLGLRQLITTPIQLKASAVIDNTVTADELVISNLHYTPKKNQDFHLMIDELHLSNQKIVGIVGPNGSGKSTLSYLLTGLTRFKKGKIMLNGQALTHKQLINQSFLVMQDVNLQLFFESVYKELTVKAKRMELFADVVERLNLSELLDRHPQSLSGGEKQRVAIGIAVLSGKKVIILDEPTSGLDLKNMLEVSRVIQWLHDLGTFVIIITHDIEFIQTTCHQVVRLVNGQIAESEQ
ncbi:hypothetical protein CBF34_07830 [Vagococcus penaei]|uniref:Uncharacterized protein n=1 Tax=Vagococcus penaei TaxID=633807 RepID=A0A1Q2D495_9ENTE|nr:ABC transporter ATP-binding protein [Vagococcus penaei]AQP53198.1 hypothetical protein BW732_02415 [Vagococcus penaei]RSU01000.1 hypothetical protein CBF34_07830 [Vagococcus penaei]